MKKTSRLEKSRNAAYNHSQRHSTPSLARTPPLPPTAPFLCQRRIPTTHVQNCKTAVRATLCNGGKSVTTTQVTETRYIRAQLCGRTGNGIALRGRLLHDARYAYKFPTLTLSYCITAAAIGGRMQIQPGRILYSLLAMPYDKWRLGRVSTDSASLSLDAITGEATSKINHKPRWTWHAKADMWDSSGRSYRAQRREPPTSTS